MSKTSTYNNSTNYPGIKLLIKSTQTPMAEWWKQLQFRLCSIPLSKRDRKHLTESHIYLWVYDGQQHVGSTCRVPNQWGRAKGSLLPGKEEKRKTVIQILFSAVLLEHQSGAEIGSREQSAVIIESIFFSGVTRSLRCMLDFCFTIQIIKEK